MPVNRLNHAVLWVRDAQTSAEFYSRVLGFEAVASMGDQAVFLRADGSTNELLDSTTLTTANTATSETTVSASAT